MKRFGVLAFLLTGGLLALSNQPASATTPTDTTNTDARASLASKLAPRYSGRIGDVAKLADAGLDESVILTYINTSPGPFQPTADDVVRLREAGISTPVINALLKRSQVLRSQTQQETAAATSTDTQNATPAGTAPVINYNVSQTQSPPASTVVYVQNYPEAQTWPVMYSTASGLCQPYYYYHYPCGSYASYTPYYFAGDRHAGFNVRVPINRECFGASRSPDGNVVYIGSRYARPEDGGWY